MKKLNKVISQAEYHLSVVQRRWDELVEKIRTNPNQMNPHGVWQGDQLRELSILHVMLIERTEFVRMLKAVKVRKRE